MKPVLNPLVFPPYLPSVGSLSNNNGDILTLSMSDLWNRVPMEEGPIFASGLELNKMYKGRMRLNGSSRYTRAAFGGTALTTLSQFLSNGVIQDTRQFFTDPDPNNNQDTFPGATMGESRNNLYGPYPDVGTYFYAILKYYENGTKYPQFVGSWLYGLLQPGILLDSLESPPYAEDDNLYDFNEVIVVKMRYDDRNANATRCLTPLPSSDCLANRITLETPSICTGIGNKTQTAYGSQCQTWWGNLSDAKKETEGLKLYNLYPDISEMMCYNREQDEEYQIMSVVPPLNTQPAQCWYLPCKLEGFDRIVEPELKNARGDCSTDFCGTIVNVVESTDIDLDNITSVVDCALEDFEADNDPGGGGNTGTGGGGNTGTGGGNGGEEEESGSSLNWIISGILTLVVILIVILIVLVRKRKKSSKDK